VVDAAVIFDVDGVLLELTRAEEDCFFGAFRELHGITGLSHDWDSYRVRNDDDIIFEVLTRHLGRDPSEAERHELRGEYLSALADLAAPPVEITGASAMLQNLRESGYTIGIATANLIDAARIRLEKAGLWETVSRHAFGADGGGHKRKIVGRAIASTGLRKHRIVYVGDNPIDVAAGADNDVYFVGFSRSAERRRQLVRSGARIVTSDHRDTLTAIRQILF
jgi:phosphoglycolate phosphatase-like HAD superfamily hydrolase